MELWDVEADEIDVTTLDANGLANLAQYRAWLATGTLPGHCDYGPTIERLRAVWHEQATRQREAMLRAG